MRTSLEKLQRCQTPLRPSAQADFDIAQFGVLRYLVSSAANVDDALVSLVRYMSVCVPTIHCRLERHSSHVLLHFDCATSSQDDSLATEIWMLRVTGLIGRLLGRPFYPGQVAFRHGPLGDRRDYLKRFGCPALFRQKNNSLVLPPTILRESCLEADPTLHSIMRFYLAPHDRHPGQLRNQVAEEILRLMPECRATLVNVAQALRMNPRTLQRRLSEEESDFEGLLDSVRREQAFRLLQQTKMGTGEIASALGYRQAGSFRRAHQRWLGISPAKFRNQFSVQPDRDGMNSEEE